MFYANIANLERTIFRKLKYIKVGQFSANPLAEEGCLQKLLPQITSTVNHKLCC